MLLGPLGAIRCWALARDELKVPTAPVEAAHFSTSRFLVGEIRRMTETNLFSKYFATGRLFFCRTVGSVFYLDQFVLEKYRNLSDTPRYKLDQVR